MEISQLKSLVQQFENSLKQKYPQIEQLGMYIQSGGSLYISDLYIKPEFIGQGFGSTIMQEMVQFADKYKLPIVLLPEAERGSNTKLILFYKKFGFVVNTGRHKDFSLSIPFTKSMYRYPR